MTPLRRLLMVIPFFPPNAGGGVHRPLSFVKHLPEHGWLPTVVAPEAESYWLRDESLVAEIPPSCPVFRTPALSGQFVLSRFRRGRPRQVRSSRGFSFLRRVAATFLVPDTYLGWYPFAVSRALSVVRETEYDAIYSTSPPETSHLIAAAVHKQTNLPWVADFRDPWMNLYLLPTPTPLHGMLHRRMERRVIEKARVVVTTRWHADLLESKYPQFREATIISNGYDGAKFGDKAGVEPSRDRFRILHAGMLTQKRSAVSFLRGLRLFLDRVPEAVGRTEAIFIGPRESDNDRAVERLRLESVASFRDTLTHDESLRLQRTSHILLLIKHADPRYLGLVPGKLYEYIGACRPILALAPPGEVAELVRKLRRGEVALPDDIEGIAQRLQRIYEIHSEGKLGLHYDLSVKESFQRQRLAGELAALLDDMTRHRSQ